MAYLSAMHIDIRPLRETDRPAIAAISRATWDGEDFLEGVFDEWVAADDAAFVGLFHLGDLVGCGRLLPLDRRRAWLEGLRVHPSAQGRGLGRIMAHHLFRLGRDRGHDELWFSTYFLNEASIQISERAGFERVAAYTHMELWLERDRTAAAASASGFANGSGTGAGTRGDVGPGGDGGITPGFRSLPGWMWNDWLFLPDDLENRERYFPEAATITRGEVTVVISRNIKYGRAWLEICGFDGPAGADPTPCIEVAATEARRRGAKGLHLMLPGDRPLDAYAAAGFTTYERHGDVYLYRADAKSLRISS